VTNVNGELGKADEGALQPPIVAVYRGFWEISIIT